MNRHLATKDEKDIRHRLVEEGRRLDKPGVKGWNKFAEHFLRPDCRTALDTRPLLRQLGKAARLGKAGRDELKRQSIFAGPNTLCLVLVGWEAEKDCEAVGFDAVSDYACSGRGYTTDPQGHSRLTTHHVREKLRDNRRHERTRCINPPTAGWDTCLGEEQPRSWCSRVAATPVSAPPAQQKPPNTATTATIDDLVGNVNESFAWTGGNRDPNHAIAIIIYDLVEHVEGGRLKPAFGANGMPDAARTKGLKEPLDPKRS